MARNLLGEEEPKTPEVVEVYLRGKGCVPEELADRMRAIARGAIADMLEKNPHLRDDDSDDSESEEAQP